MNETFAWCKGCKEYDTEQHCCHRFSKAIYSHIIEAYLSGYDDGKDAGYTDGIKEGWISVSERLPEVKCYEEEYVLVTDGKYVTDGCAMRLNEDDPVDLSASHIDSSHIVAWMPMRIPNIKGKTMGDIWEERARREKDERCR